MTTETPPTEPTPAATPAKPSRRPWLVGIAVAVVLVVFGRPILRSFLPKPRLAPAVKLLKEGKYSEAEVKLAEMLSYEPANPQIRIFLAWAKLDRDDPKPAEALETLEPIRLATASQAAQAMVFRGRAYLALNQPGKAESCWLDALKADLLVGEAGWHLLELYYDEGREAEGRALALQLSKDEPNPGDRVRYLLEPIRYDAEPLAAAGLIPKFSSAVKVEPDNRPSSLAYYRAMAKDGTGVEPAMIGLRRLVEKFPDDLSCWDGYLFALDSTGDLDGMAKALAEMPKTLTADPRIMGYRGRLALHTKDYAAAIPDLERAVSAFPSDSKLLHLLGDAYRLAGQADKADVIKAREVVLEEARVELRGIKGKEQEEGRPGLFEEATSRRDLGLVPNPSLYKRIADNRERMGHPDEALAWHQIVLRDNAEDAESLEAVSRLGGETKPEK